jgi:hypothetical protein
LRRKLAEPHVFAMINVNIQKQFRSSYALALYENCVRFKGTKSTGWISVQNWKRLLGVVRYDASGEPLKSAYDTFKVFRSKVIAPAVDEVNAVSDIVLTPEWEKEQNAVARIKFHVEKKAQQSLFDNLEAVESEGFNALRAIGCSEDLIRSILDEGGDERALDLAEYVTQQDSVENPAAYVRTLHDSNANLKKKPKPKPAPTPAPLTTLPVEPVKPSVVTSLTNAELADLRREFMANHSARWNAEIERFDGALANAQFTTFAIERAADVIANRGK